MTSTERPSSCCAPRRPSQTAGQHYSSSQQKQQQLQHQSLPPLIQSRCCLNPAVSSTSGTSCCPESPQTTPEASCCKPTTPQPYGNPCSTQQSCSPCQPSIRGLSCTSTCVPSTSTSPSLSPMTASAIVPRCCTIAETLSPSSSPSPAAAPPRPYPQPNISAQEIECCIIESVLKDGINSTCCQDILPSGTVTYYDSIINQLNSPTAAVVTPTTDRCCLPSSSLSLSSTSLSACSSLSSYSMDGIEEATTFCCTRHKALLSRGSVCPGPYQGDTIPDNGTTTLSLSPSTEFPSTTTTLIEQGPGSTSVRDKPVQESFPISSSDKVSQTSTSSCSGSSSSLGSCGRSNGIMSGPEFTSTPKTQQATSSSKHLPLSLSLSSPSYSRCIPSRSPSTTKTTTTTTTTTTASAYGSCSSLPGTCTSTSSPFQEKTCLIAKVQESDVPMAPSECWTSSTEGSMASTGYNDGPSKSFSNITTSSVSSSFPRSFLPLSSYSSPPALSPPPPPVSQSSSFPMTPPHQRSSASSFSSTSSSSWSPQQPNSSWRPLLSDLMDERMIASNPGSTAYFRGSSSPSSSSFPMSQETAFERQRIDVPPSSSCSPVPQNGQQCLWEGCLRSEFFQSSSEILHHISNTHVVFQGAIPVQCLWNGCWVQCLGGQALFYHLQSTHGLALPPPVSSTVSSTMAPAAAVSFLQPVTMAHIPIWQPDYDNGIPQHVQAQVQAQVPLLQSQFQPQYHSRSHSQLSQPRSQSQPQPHQPLLQQQRPGLWSAHSWQSMSESSMDLDDVEYASYSSPPASSTQQVLPMPSYQSDHYSSPPPPPLTPSRQPSTSWVLTSSASPQSSSFIKLEESSETTLIIGSTASPSPSPSPSSPSRPQQQQQQQQQFQPQPLQQLQYQPSISQEEQESRFEHPCLWQDCKAPIYSTFEDLTAHLSEVHIGMGKSEYICLWESCDRLGRGFQQRQKAMRHIQTHTGDKPFQCVVCQKRFSEQNIMAQHMRTHTGEKPFKCSEPGCGRQFSISGALTIHRRVHSGEKPFKCRYEGCEKWFAESSNLTKHLRVHTGARPFSCSFEGCEKKFSRPDQVLRHKKTHPPGDIDLDEVGAGGDSQQADQILR